MAIGLHISSFRANWYASRVHRNGPAGCAGGARYRLPSALRGRASSMSSADSTSAPLSTYRLAVKPPVSVLSAPTIIGATSPALPPMVLMSAMPAAAALLDMKLPGIAHSTVKALEMPIDASARHSTAATGCA